MTANDGMRSASAMAPAQSMTQEDIVQSVGDLEDAKIAAILEIAPTAEELEKAIAWAEGESDAMGELEKPLSGAASRVYEILMTRKELGEDERRS